MKEQVSHRADPPLRQGLGPLGPDPLENRGAAGEQRVHPAGLAQRGQPGPGTANTLEALLALQGFLKEFFQILEETNQILGEAVVLERPAGRNRPVFQVLNAVDPLPARSRGKLQRADERRETALERGGSRGWARGLGHAMENSGLGGAEAPRPAQSTSSPGSPEGIGHQSIRPEALRWRPPKPGLRPGWCNRECPFAGRPAAWRRNPSPHARLRPPC